MLFALGLVVATLYSYFFESLNCKSTSLLKVALHVQGFFVYKSFLTLIFSYNG
jgi:hypothetical protein